MCRAPLAITLSARVAAICLIARRSRRRAYMGHRRGVRRARSHTASGSSVSAGACVVLRAIAAVAGTPAPTISKASLAAAACRGTQAQLSRAWNAQLVGRHRALDGSRRRRRGGAEHRLCRSLGTLVRAAGDHQLAHPVGALITRARAAWAWRRAHARRLHRHPCVLQHLVFAGAERGRLRAARLDRRTAADAVDLSAWIRRQAHGVRLARATPEHAQGTQRGAPAQADPEQFRRSARRADAATGRHRNR
jgi:hypothetical protein